MRTIVLLCLILATAFANAQPTDLERSKKVDELFAGFNRTDHPGYSVAVIRDGKTIHAKGYGMADLERDVRITPRTVFDIGSTSKQFTAASILLLEQEGKLSLDDDVRKYFPEFREYDRPITIRHLIHHTSGIRDYLAIMGLSGLSFNNDYSDEETLSWIARQKALNFAPGDEHLYSNSGYYMLGQLVERVSGLSLRDYAAKKIFEPLGMTNTHFHDDPSEIVRHRAIGYSPDGEGLQIDMSGYHVVGDGGVYSTTEDLAKWDANFYDPKVGGTALLDALHRRGKLTSGKEIDYASALMHRTHKGHRTVQHGGAWAGYRAEMLRFPDAKLTIIALANLGTADPSAMAASVADIYLEPRVTEAPATATSAPKPSVRTKPVALRDLEKLTGLYRHPDFGYRAIEVREGKLTYLRGNRPAELRPISNSEFQIATSPASARFESGALVIIAPGVPDVRYTRVEPVNPGAGQLAEYAGTYRSDETVAPHHLRVRDGKLVARIGFSSEEMVLEPRDRDAFEASMGPGITLSFERDDRGAITGYTINAGRVKSIRFVKERV